MNWRQEKQALEDAYARRLLIEYNIQEVTTQRQAKNGTREFEFPVKTKYSKKLLRLACFKSGYVRKQNDTYSPYQLNKQYKQEQRQMLLIDGKLQVRTYMAIARVPIWGMLGMMNYMLEYYKRNWLNK
tara:strand:+ start:258 stop:641 length:384 start_codon:yes stop_codon:yes gene_type:complete